VFCLEKNTCCIVGTLEVLGLRGYWGVELIVFANPALNICLVSETKPCSSSRINFCGDSVVGYELPSHIKQHVNS
jgi:hypothetical protein